MTTLHTKLKATTFLTDGGLETELIFNKGIDLPHFAAFPLIDQPLNRNILKSYYKGYLELARKYQTGFILESPTWRANPDWAFKLGYSNKGVSRINIATIALLKELCDEYSNSIQNLFISGCIGPRGDGYAVKNTMSSESAATYHDLQICALKNGGANFISALTMTYTEEALGIVQASKNNDIPVVISFTVETNGNLPSGETLKSAINKIDQATNSYPLYYMINCAHPTHFMDKLEEEEAHWKSRIQGIRANASCKSHSELDEATELDLGDKEQLGKLHATLKKYLPNLNIYGGCCGTDTSHITSICNHIINKTITQQIP